MAESYLHTWCAHAWPINPHAPVGIGGVIELAPMPHSTIGIDVGINDINATQVLSSHLLGYLCWVGWGLIWLQALDVDIVPESQ